MRSKLYLARISHQLSAADDDAPYPAVFSRLGVLDVLSSTPPRPSDQKPRWARHLVALATKPGEICGLAVAVCLLSACASAPKIDYYTLAMEPSGQARPTVNLVVGRLQTTEALGRSQILISTSSTEVDYYATDLWAGSVGELVQQKLAVEFGPPVEGRRTLKVSGTVLAFEQVDVGSGAEGRVKLQIEVRDAAIKQYEKPLLEKTYEVRRSASMPSAAAVVVALSECIEQIAAEIATDVWSP